ncbi:hypothetical protein HHL22_10205 [Hymenobacter sp. RP-2-7]|uniref:Uncharacterized protein n=1 Tax=Hymenobacter polaris TaxID=2682546 RepID=A0A7Y0FM86_9BACT|nr:hypothetical protein [Hymenobacter polaris]NML65577.1 hypothetical protein [Hymenobacter polaris]
MHPAILTGFLVISSLAAQAQAYYLSLAATPMPLVDCPVAVEQVLDGRGQQAAIGFVYRGLGNKPAAVLFKRGLGPELTDYLHAQLATRAADHPVVLCLRQLRVSEELGSLREQANADLAADVYEHLPDGYHFVQSVGAHTSAHGLDLTSEHASHLAQLLAQCLNQLTQADWPAVTARPALPLAQLPADAPASLGPAGRRSPGAAILREAPRRGIYHGFEQFLANRPDTTLAFQLDTLQLRHKSALATRKWLGVARVRPLPTQRGTALPAELWGFSTGQQLFVRHHQHYFPLMRQGSFFTFVGEAPVDLEYAHARAEAQGHAMMMAGAVGAGVAPVRATDHTAEPMAYAVDMRTGGLAPFPGLNAGDPFRLDTAYVYVYRPAAPTPGPAAVRVLLNDQVAGSLGPGEYLELPWPAYARPLRLRLEGLPGPSPCQYLVPNARRRNYLRLTPTTPAQAWQWVAPAQGEADLDELDRLRK